MSVRKSCRASLDDIFPFIAPSIHRLQYSGIGFFWGPPIRGANPIPLFRRTALVLSQGLSLELAPNGIYVQAVLPATTRTEIWEHVSADVNTLSNVMEVDDLVDAALVGFDRREPVTIPPLPDAGQWDVLVAARQAMLPNYGNQHPAERYSTVA